MSYPLPLTRTEAYLAYKAGVIQQSDLKPSLAVPRIGIDAWLAYWTELADDYPKNPDGTPMILQEEEAYIAYLCGVINEYPEKCLRRVGAYLRYIISARWGRPDHPLNREELYLSLIKTQFIPSGDPSTDIEIDGTAKAQFVDVKMYGDTFQQAYTGKNLLKFVPSTGGLNGLTVSYNEASGVVRVSGTPTQNWSNIDSTTKTMSLPAGSYILSVDNPSPLYRINFRIYDPNASGGYIDIHGGEGGNYVKFTLENDETDVVMRVYIDHNYDLTAVDWSFKIMLESGSDITLPYEPYVGGMPSPSPDYPQPIQTVTGEQTVTVTGKNIFDGQLEIGGWVISTGQTCEHATNNNAYRCINPIPVKPSSTYSFSVNGARFDGFRTIFCDSNMTVISSVIVNTTIVTPASCAYITFYSSALKTQFPNLSDIKTTQLEKSADVSSYVPYSSNDYKINLGKNLLESVPATANTRGITTTVDSSTGEIIMQGESTQNYPWITDTTVYIPAGTYTFSLGNTLPYQMYVRFYYDETNHTDINVNAGVTSKTITLPNDTIRIVLLYNLGGSGVVVPATRLKLQLEEGSTVTPYAPYFAPIELCKFNDYQDYIWKDQDQWKVHKETFKHQFDGIGDGWNYSSTTHAVQDQNYNVAQTGAVKFDVPGVAVCDKFGYSPSTGAVLSNIPNNNFGFQTSGSYYATFRSDTYFTTRDDAIAWLRANKPTAYWALATPTDTIITNQALIDQLEALVKGGSEEGTTYIKVSATDPNLPGLLYVEAPKYE